MKTGVSSFSPHESPHSLFFLRLFQMYDGSTTAAGASPGPLQVPAGLVAPTQTSQQQDQLLQHQLNAVATLAAQQQPGHATSTAALSDLLAQASASPAMGTQSTAGVTGASALDTASALYGPAAALNASHLMASAFFVLPSLSLPRSVRPHTSVTTGAILVEIMSRPLLPCRSCLQAH